MVRALLLGFPMTTQIEGLLAPTMLPLAARPRPGEAPTLDRIRGNTEGWCLRAGHQGDSVAELRSLLRSAGYALPAGNTVDGETERAIRAFQERAGLVVDGKAGARTLEALEHVRANPPLIAASQQAGAARALGDAPRALAPAARGPIADGVYINPATGQLVMARPMISPAFEGPGRATIPAAEGGGIGGLLGPAIAAARTPAGLPSAALAPRSRLLNELGEPIGPRAAPTTPPLVRPDLEPLRPGPRAPAPRLLLPDEVIRPAAPPPPLVRPDLEPLRPAARAAAPRLLLPDEVLPPSAPPPPLVRPDLEPLRPAPRSAAPRIIVPEGALDLPAAPRAPAAAAPAPTVAAPRAIEHGEGLDRLYRETANRSLAQQGAGVQLERGQTLQDLVNEQRITPAQRRVAQQAFETLSTDGAYRDAANAALERQGSPARLRPGETLTTLFERGEINRSTLNVAREAALDTGFARSVEHQAGAAPAPARGAAAPEPGMMERAAARARGVAETVRTAELSPGAATALRYGGRGLMAVGAVLDAADVVGAVQADAARGDGRSVETIRTSGRVAGGWLGAAGGAALAGAAAGTIVPGLGNVAGFLVGAAGGAIGYWLGSGAGEAVGTAVAG